MNDQRVTQALLFALILTCAALLYLDWRRQGEIDYLAEELLRVDKRTADVGKHRRERQAAS